MKKVLLHMVCAGLWLMALPGCSETEQIVPHSEMIDVELRPFLNLFEDEAERREQAIKVADHLARAEIVVMEENLAGQCSFSETQPNEMRISRSFWEQAGTTEREYAVFHELGHCVLNRMHQDSLDENGECTSLMHSKFFPCSSFYDENRREELLDELFANW